MSPKCSTWEDKALLQKVLDQWSAGASLSEIARDVGSELNLALTRNAVAGKLHRLNLPPRDVPFVIPPPKDKPKRKRLKRSTRTNNVYTLPLLEPHSGSLTLFELGQDDCRFPLGDYPHRWCARQTRSGSPYCAEHHKHCYCRSRRSPTGDREG